MNSNLDSAMQSGQRTWTPSVTSHVPKATEWHHITQTWRITYTCMHGNYKKCLITYVCKFIDSYLLNHYFPERQLKMFAIKKRCLQHTVLNFLIFLLLSFWLLLFLIIMSIIRRGNVCIPWFCVCVCVSMGLWERGNYVLELKIYCTASSWTSTEWGDIGVLIYVGKEIFLSQQLTNSTPEFYKQNILPTKMY